MMELAWVVSECVRKVFRMCFLLPNRGFLLVRLFIFFVLLSRSDEKSDSMFVLVKLNVVANCGHCY